MTASSNNPQLVNADYWPKLLHWPIECWWQGCVGRERWPASDSRNVTTSTSCSLIRLNLEACLGPLRLEKNRQLTSLRAAHWVEQVIYPTNDRTLTVFCTGSFFRSSYSGAIPVIPTRNPCKRLYRRRRSLAPPTPPPPPLQVLLILLLLSP